MSATANNNHIQETPPQPDVKVRKLTNSNKSSRIQPKTDSYVKEKPTWLENFKDYFSEYCSSSGVHGVRYLGESERFIIEKLVWTITLGVMCYFCIILILKSYNKWESTPVIVTFATTETSISKIPFPAVTICPEVKSDPEFFNYSDAFLKKISNSYLSPEENEILEGLTLVCPGIISLPDLITKIKKNSSATVNSSLISELFDIAPEITDDGFVIWLGKERNKDILSKIYTSEGLCYSFNIIDPKELQVNPGEYQSISSTNYTKLRGWSLEHGYLNEDNGDYFPRRTLVSGTIGGLIVDAFTNNTHIDRFCSEASEGYQVTIHHPAELPNMDYSFRLPLDQIVSVAIKPRMITVSEELKQYKPEFRKCYFSNERNLLYFNSYSQQNCLFECLSNFSIKQCGCVDFFMPKLKSFPICGLTGVDCMIANGVNYLLINSNNTLKNCNCLPSCTSLQYDVEISQSDWPWRESFTVLKSLIGEKYSNAFDDIEIARLSRLIVYFKEMQFLSLERHELYGATDFFSNTGGLLGLFIGFSITSAFEILYFLTLRLVCNIKKYGRDFWSGQDDN